ncbi:MAG: hypothetical protein ACLQMT_13335 [Candidatus Acidiferrales bacterium]
MDSQTDVVTGYRVEVSGWDASEGFFVEKTSLNWGHGTQPEIRLRAILRESCIVFVRLLQPIDDGANFPVAYRALKVMAKDADGWTRIFLAQLRPRASYRETARAVVEDTTVRVA